ncbi:MAG: N-acetyltransferase family protein [Nitrososphaerota archaeon]
MPLPVEQEAANLAGTLTLRNGEVFHWRAIRPDDAPRLQAFHHRLSHQSLFFRFFGEMPELSRELAERLSHVDYADRMAIVVTPGTGADEPIVAVARYQRAEPDAAEFAIVTEDRWQGQGIGPQLLRVLAVYARRRGFTTLIANVLYDNDRMLAMLRHIGIPSVHHLREGRVEARLDITGLDAGTPAEQQQTDSPAAEQP